MQFFESSNMITPENIVNATVNAFNGQSSVKTHKGLLPIEKSRLIANDRFYVDVQPYNIFYRLAVSLAASVDKDGTKALFGLNDAQINAIAARTKAGLETGHEKTWSALNQIETAAKKDGYTIPELAQIKEHVPPKQDFVRRLYRPTVALPAPSPNLVPEYKKAAAIVEKKSVQPANKPAPKPIKTKIKPAEDLATAATAPKKPAVQRRKRADITLSKEITSLTIPKICEAGMKIYDQMGLGLVSMEDFSNRTSVTQNAMHLRELAAYTIYRVLPSANYSLERIADGAFLRHSPLKNALERVEDKVRAQDKSTLSFLNKIGKELGLTDYQKTLLFVPERPRFKSWGELQDNIRAKGQAPSRSPEAP